MKTILVIFVLMSQASFVVGQTMNEEPKRNSVEQELRKLESHWQEALTHRDVTVLDRLMADDYALTTISGEVVDKARVLAEVKSANANADVRNTDVAVRHLR